MASGAKIRDARRTGSVLRLFVFSAVLALCVNRVGFYAPSPGVDHERLRQHFQSKSDVASDAARP